jgi:hypothetical protein
MNLHLPMHPLCRLNEARPPVGSGLEIDYVIRDARKWVVDPKRTASEFDAGYYRGLLEKALGEEAFVYCAYAREK